MRFFRTVVFILLLITIFPVLVFSETGNDSAEPVETPTEEVPADEVPEEEAAKGINFTVSIDARIGGSLVGIIPGISGIIGVPMSLSDESISFAPQFGFIYYFSILTDYHNEYYVPIGINLLYNPYSLGLDFLFYPAVGGTNTNNMFSVTIVNELNLYTKEFFSLLLEFKFGSMFVFDPTGTKAQAMINLAIIPRFKL